MRIEMLRIKILAGITGLFLDGTICALERKQNKTLKRHARMTKRLHKEGQKGFKSLITTLTNDYKEDERLSHEMKRLNALFNAIQNMQDDLAALRTECAH